MIQHFDHVLILGFGGPENHAEIIPFLEQVTRGRNIPRERLLGVAHHYELIGGKSPYNGWARELTNRILGDLKADAVDIPIYLAFRNVSPNIEEVLNLIIGKGHQNGLLMILAPHRSVPSTGRYLDDLNAALQKINPASLRYEEVEPWFSHPLFISAIADEIRKVRQTDGNPQPLVIFTAHSIPVRSARESRYSQEFLETCQQAAKMAKIPYWRIAYQSRSGSPRDPWLEPDLLLVLESLQKRNIKRVLLVPVGFLCDNAEVLYDLDIEAHARASELGIELKRASTVTLHPAFIQMWVELIKAKLSVHS